MVALHLCWQQRSRKPSLDLTSLRKALTSESPTAPGASDTLRSSPQKCSVGRSMLCGMQNEQAYLRSWHASRSQGSISSISLQYRGENTNHGSKKAETSKTPKGVKNGNFSERNASEAQRIQLYALFSGRLPFNSSVSSDLNLNRVG